jgi:hypothetical protein
MRIQLRRDNTPRSDCTLGTLTVGDKKFATIERPWVPSPLSKGGAKGVSCVPKGLYRLVRHDSEAHDPVWALVNKDLDVVHYPGDSPNSHARTVVLIHAANLASEVRGCIAPGMRAVVWPSGQNAVAESKKAMKLIKAAMPWTDEHEIEIT